MGGLVDSALDFVGLGAPEPPDPYATSAAQSKSNLEAILESAKINQMGLNLPGYNVNYTGEIGSPDRTMNLALSPDRQQLAQILSGGANTMAGDMDFGPVDWGGVPGIPGEGDFGAEAQRSEDAMYKALMSRMSPVMDRNQRRLDTQLATQGIPIGSDAYSDVQEQFARERGDQELGVANQAIMSGRAEQGRLFGQGLASRQQGMSDVVTQNQLPYSNLASLLAMDPRNQVQAPGQPAYQMAPPDISGAVMQNYGIQSQNRNAMLGGLAGLGGAAILGSDRRLKHNIERIGSLASGIPVYRFSYLGSGLRRVGVMAQEVLDVIPDAVIEAPDGYYMVDYSRLH